MVKLNSGKIKHLYGKKMPPISLQKQEASGGSKYCQPLQATNHNIHNNSTSND